MFLSLSGSVKAGDVIPGSNTDRFLAGEFSMFVVERDFCQLFLIITRPKISEKVNEVQEKKTGE